LTVRACAPVAVTSTTAVPMTVDFNMLVSSCIGPTGHLGQG
jgi:hypothetical protein